MVVGDVGDSTAILLQSNVQNNEPNASLSTHQLTESHNVVDNPKEEARIQKHFGRMTEIVDGYLRPKEEAYNFHQIAMTRALDTHFFQLFIYICTIFSLSSSSSFHCLLP
jgi:serine/threonine protein phosphatase PrpC